MLNTIVNGNSKWYFLISYSWIYQHEHGRGSSKNIYSNCTLSFFFFQYVTSALYTHTCPHSSFITKRWKWTVLKITLQTNYGSVLQVDNKIYVTYAFTNEHFQKTISARISSQAFLTHFVIDSLWYFWFIQLPSLAKRILKFVCSHKEVITLITSQKHLYHIVWLLNLTVKEVVTDIEWLTDKLV